MQTSVLVVLGQSSWQNFIGVIISVGGNIEHRLAMANWQFEASVLLCLGNDTIWDVVAKHWSVIYSNKKA